MQDAENRPPRDQTTFPGVETYVINFDGSCIITPVSPDSQGLVPEVTAGALRIDKLLRVRIWGAQFTFK